MFEISKQTLQKFNDLNASLFASLKIPDANKPMVLNGSYARTLWASDIDLFQQLSPTDIYFLKDFLTAFLTQKHEKIWFGSLKVGNREYKSRTRAIRKLLSDFDVNETLNVKWGRYWIKVNVFVMDRGYIEDISMIYDLTPDGKGGVPPSLRDDAVKLIKEGRFYKALKRLASLGNREKIQAYLDPVKVGFLYLTLSRLRAIQDAKMIPLPLRREALSNIKEDIEIKLKLSPNVPFYLKNVPRIISILQETLNSRLRTPIRIFGR